MGNSFETITVLQYRLKAAQEELAAFQSGEKYIRDVYKRQGAHPYILQLCLPLV